MIQQLDLFKVMTRKEQGQQRVMENAGEWKDLVLGVILEISGEKREFTSDDIRERCLKYLITPPHHPNAWGAMMTSAHKQGYIHKTGSYISSRIECNNSRMIAIWTKKRT